MNEQQRETALRLADDLKEIANTREPSAAGFVVMEAAALLGELAAERRIVAWLDCWGEPHRTREMAMNSDESEPTPLYE